MLINYYESFAVLCVTLTFFVVFVYMKIALNEIWNFHKFIKPDEKGWSYVLHAGDVEISGITNEILRSLSENEQYDTELLPSIFTFREILWQPDVFTDTLAGLPSLRILKAFCNESSETAQKTDKAANKIYVPLIKGLGNCCGQATERLQKKKPDIKRIIGDFRIGAFPIIKFFIYHPKNRHDYYVDAVNRLNYAVKIMLTQFYGRYTELEDPYWHVVFDKNAGAKNKKPEQPKTEKKAFT